MRRLLSRLPRASSIFAVFVYIFLYAPIGIVIINSFNADQTLTSWGGATLEWYKQAMSNARVREDFFASVLIAAGTMVLSAILAITAAVWMRGRSGRASNFLDSSTYLRIVLPEIVFALGLFLLLKNLGLPLGAWAIIIGHTAIYSAYATVIVQARMATMPATLEAAAQDLGASPARAFWRVTAPLLAPGVLAGGILAFTFSFDSVIMSLFLGGTNTETLPVLLLGMMRRTLSPEVNAIGSGVAVITLVLFATSALIAVAVTNSNTPPADDADQNDS